jgi:hypothetical protein
MFRESYELVRALQGRVKTGERCLELLKSINAKNHLVDEQMLALLTAEEFRAKSQSAEIGHIARSSDFSALVRIPYFCRSDFTSQMPPMC